MFNSFLSNQRPLWLGNRFLLEVIFSWEGNSSSAWTRKKKRGFLHGGVLHVLYGWILAWIRTLLSLDIPRLMDLNVATITLDNLYLGRQPTVGSLSYETTKKKKKGYVYMKGAEINCIKA